MKLVFVTQAIDADDPNLAQTLDVVRGLAQRCNELIVVCDRVGRHDLPVAVTFETFGAPTRVGRGLRFQAALVRAFRGRRPDALLAHMVPLFLVLAAPLARARGVPLVLWYTHWHAGRTARLATRVCDAALSVDRRSFPVPTDKVRGIGHGIDVARFPARGELPPSNGCLRLLALGRTERRKGLMTVLDAVERAAAGGLDVALEIRGPQVNEAERRHRGELEKRIRSSDLLRGRVSLSEPVPREQLPELIRSADAVVSATRGETAGGALDKVVYESAACAVPVIACNPHLDDFLGGLPVELRFAGGDSADLARVLGAFASTGSEERAATGRELRRRVEAGHSVSTWADGVLRVVRELGARGRRRPERSGTFVP